MPTVRANTTCMVTHNGVPVVIRDGERLDENDPIVVAFPAMFDRMVEQATAAPGERRNVRRKP